MFDIVMLLDRLRAGMVVNYSQGLYARSIKCRNLRQANTLFRPSCALLCGSDPP